MNTWILGASDDLPWRQIAREIRRWRLLLLVGFACSLSSSLLLLKGPSYYKVPVTALAGLSLATIHTGAALLRGVRNDKRVVEMLATPLPASAYASAIMRLYLWYVAAFFLAIPPAAGCALQSGDTYIIRIMLDQAFYLFCASSAVFWGHALGSRWLLTAVSIPGLAGLASQFINYYHQQEVSALSQNLQLSTKALISQVNVHYGLQIFHQQLVFYLSEAALAAFAVTCVIRCYRGYDDVLRKRLP